MSDLTNAIETINEAADRAENTSDFLDNWSTYDENSYVTNPNNDETVASAAKLVKDRTDVLFGQLENDLASDVEEANENAATSLSKSNDNEFMIWLGA